MTKPNPLKRSSGRFLSFGIVIILIGFAVVFFLPSAFVNLMAKRLSQATNLPVNIRHLDVRLSRPEFLILDLKFLNPKGFPPAELASIGEVKVQYIPPPLVLGQLDVKKIEINFKELRLIRNEAGDINLPIRLPVQAVGDTIDELILNLNSVTYTDLSEKQAVQKTFQLGLERAVYRNVKGVAGILEIVSWEVLKRAGIDPEKQQIQEAPVETVAPTAVLNETPTNQASEKPNIPEIAPLPEPQAVAPPPESTQPQEQS